MALGFRRSVRRGFDSLTLGPSPELRRMRRDAELQAKRARSRLMQAAGPLPPLPDSAYPPGAVPLDTSGIPGGRQP